MSIELVWGIENDRSDWIFCKDIEEHVMYKIIQNIESNLVLVICDI